MFRKATLCAVASLGGLARSQTCNTTGPDAVIGEITGTFNVAAVDGLDATSLGTQTCNIGDLYIVCRGDNTNRHPVQGQNLFRLSTVDGVSRFEQIGQAWLFHHFFELSQQLCCPDCVPPAMAGDLGAHCATPDSAGSTAGQAGAGPKRQVNAATALFPYPPASPPYSGNLARRLRFRIADVDPALHPGALFFGECQILTSEDAAAGNAENNVSYRRCTISVSNNNASVGLTGATQRAAAAIRAWQDNDPAVVESEARVPDEGLFIVAAKATDLGNGTWRYEYAVQNLNSDRSCGSFSVPVSRLVTVTNIGFHDVDYLDGDGNDNVNFDGSDWPAAYENNELRWSTQTFAENNNANALRWGTLYNFRFDATSPPMIADAEIGLYKPGAVQSILAMSIPTPQTPPCRADFNGDGFVTGQDFDLYVAAFESGDVSVDFDGDGFVTGADFDAYVQAFEAGC